MLKIRLTRMGKKHQPSYRIVVMPKERPVAGQYLELVGTYNPLKEELSVNNDRVMEWLNKGAKPSDRVARLLSKVGLKHTSIVIKHYAPKPKAKESAAVTVETPAEAIVEPQPEEITE